LEAKILLDAGVKALVEVRDLVVKRGDRVVLEVPQLEIRQGEVLSVIGPNGAGKSTLLYVLALLHPPAAGEMWFGGHRLSSGDDMVKLRRRMAVVFQEALLLDASVKDNVLAGLRLRGGVARPQAGKRASYWMKRFGVEQLAGRHARQLSGGEAQRVSLARAFVMEPELLLLDEPFSALDAPTRSALFEDFEQVLRDSHTTTVFVTHDRSEAMRLGDRIAVVIDGRLAQVAEPEVVFSSPADERIASFVGVENLIPGRVQQQQDGLALVSLGAVSVEVASDLPSGRRVLVGLRPEDVVLALPFVDRQPSSARNHLQGRVTRVTPLGSLVRVSVDCGVPLVTLVTRRSSDELGLADGVEVMCSFKATAMHLLAR